MTIRESIKTEIDTLPSEALYSVMDFVLYQKERIRPRHKEKNVEWLKQPWKIDGFKPLQRDDIYERP